MRKLSEFNFSGYAYCYECREFFEDDLPIYGSILCPNNCGNVVMRRIKELPQAEVNNARQTQI